MLTMAGKLKGQIPAQTCRHPGRCESQLVLDPGWLVGQSAAQGLLVHDLQYSCKAGKTHLLLRANAMLLPSSALMHASAMRAYTKRLPYAVCVHARGDVLNVVSPDLTGDTACVLYHLCRSLSA